MPAGRRRTTYFLRRTVQVYRSRRPFGLALWLCVAALPFGAYPAVAGASAGVAETASVRIIGAPETLAGHATAPAGDVNGDGLEDLIVGAPNESRNQSESGRNSGAAYVVFGDRSKTDVSLGLRDDGSFPIIGAARDGSFRIIGAAGGDQAGFAVAGAGDVNGDGLADVIVGAPGDPNIQGSDVSGKAYVVFGQRGAAATDTVDLATLEACSELGLRACEVVHPRGYAILGPTTGTLAGFSVSSVGDVNKDGLADVAIGAPYAHNRDRVWSGSVYVVFGKATPGRLHLAAMDGNGWSLPADAGSVGLLGFRIDGAAPGEQAGSSIAGGEDVNGDLHPDIVVGAPGAGAYIVFGGGETTNLDLAELGDRGFAIRGGGAQQIRARSVATAGDVNADGLSDVIVADHSADPNARSNSGSAYVVFGSSSKTRVDLGSLEGRGFRIDGQRTGELVGYAVDGAGDVDGDGLGDIVLGAPGEERSHRGGAYVVRGSRSTTTVDLLDAGARAVRLDGAGFGTGRAVAGIPDFVGEGTPEVVVTQELLNTAFLITIDTAAPRVDVLTPQDQAEYHAGTRVTADYACSDDAGGWGIASCSGDVPNGAPIDTSSLGIKTFTVVARDRAGNTTSVTNTYKVVNRDPDCGALGAAPTRLTDPNGTFRSVRLGGATDPDGDALSVEISGVTQDEPLGDTTPDARRTDATDVVELRAERDGKGDGRIYRIHAAVSDPYGGRCVRTVKVSVPHDAGRGAVAVESDPVVDSFG